MWCFERRAFLALTLGLVGCGFEPVYGPDQDARQIRDQVYIKVQPGREAFEMRERLLERIGQAPVDARYEISHQLTIESDELVLTSSVEIARYVLSGSAEFIVIDRQEGEAVYSGQVYATTAYSATSETYPTRVAEQDARLRLVRSLADQINTRLAVSAGDWLE